MFVEHSRLHRVSKKTVLYCTSHNVNVSQVEELKELLEDQNSSVASALRSALRNEELRGGRDGAAQSETDIVILKALSKLNR